MIYQLLADTLLGLHLLFILFVIFGGLLVLRWRWVWPVHILAAVWGTLIELFGWICPLTPMENRLRRLGGAAGYEGGFIEHYLVPLVYPGNLTQELQIFLGTALIVLNVIIYFFVVQNIRKRKKAGGPRN